MNPGLDEGAKREGNAQRSSQRNTKSVEPRITPIARIREELEIGTTLSWAVPVAGLEAHFTRRGGSSFFSHPCYPCNPWLKSLES